MNNNFNKARYEQQPRVEKENVNAVEELQSEETTKKGMMEVLGDNKGMIAGGIIAAAAVTGIIVYRKKIWGWMKKPFTKNQAAEATAEQPAAEPKKEADQK